MNKLFAALYDLILCRIAKMISLAPSPGSILDSIFQRKNPKLKSGDATERGKIVIIPELIAYLKRLIYTASAAFKDPGDG